MCTNGYLVLYWDRVGVDKKLKPTKNRPFVIENPRVNAIKYLKSGKAGLVFMKKVR